MVSTIAPMEMTKRVSSAKVSDSENFPKRGSIPQKRSAWLFFLYKMFYFTSKQRIHTVTCSLCSYYASTVKYFYGPFTMFLFFLPRMRHHDFSPVCLLLGLSQLCSHHSIPKFIAIIPLNFLLCSNNAFFLNGSQL